MRTSTTRQTLAKTSTLLALLLTFAVALAGCGADTATETPATETPATDAPAAEQPATDSDAVPAELSWLDTELVDVQTGETFRISDFKGKPVLVKSFAVW